MKFRSLLMTGLAAIALSSCTPNLSTPENTLTTFLETAKDGKDPMKVCGYKEKNVQSSWYSNNNKDADYYRPFTVCSGNVSKCIQYNGSAINTRANKEQLREIDLIVTQEGNLPRFDWFKKNEQGTTYFPKESGTYPMIKFWLQKESDGKWRVADDRKIEFYFNNN
ncbi:MAG: hypothetical protein KKD48_01410 [Nanoarchaeota archaeon]|nr:hypothetical protein [Nanoarchaeota archaeon]